MTKRMKLNAIYPCPIESNENCVRTYLVAGEIAISQQDYESAFEYLKLVPEKDITWLSEAVPLLEQVAEKSNDWQRFEALIESYWQQCATAYLSKVKLLAEKNTKHEAIHTLTEQLDNRPTMRGFSTLLSFYQDIVEDKKEANSLQKLKKAG